MNLLFFLAVSLAPAIGPSFGTRGDTLKLEAAIRQALAANPMLRAARLKAQAAAERVAPRGALPEPELSLSLMNRMISSPSSTMDPMTMNQVQLTQMVPWFGKLGLDRERANRIAQAELLEAEEAERMLVAQVKSLYYRLAYIDRALAIMNVSRDLLQGLVQVSQAMYAAGTAVQQDVLQAQVAVARMIEEITSMEQERIAMAARFNALLGREAGLAIPALELPQETAELPPADSLIALAVARRPALRAAAARVAGAGAAYRLARRELYPDFMIGISYAQRPAYQDMGSLMLGFRIPLWVGSRQLPMRREMEAMRAMAEAEAQDLYYRTYEELVELRAEAERSRRLGSLYVTSIVPQARASVEAALAAYRVGKVDYLNVVENQMVANRYETESVRLLAAYWQAVAEIEARVGGALEGGSENNGGTR
jgi:outer membrane protein TolC